MTYPKTSHSTTFASKRHSAKAVSDSRLETSLLTSMSPQGTSRPTTMSTLMRSCAHSRIPCILAVPWEPSTPHSLITKKLWLARSGPTWVLRTLIKTTCSGKTLLERFKSLQKRFLEFLQKKPKSLPIFPSPSSLRTRLVNMACQTGSEVIRLTNSMARMACQTPAIP